jgi:hypothetical protein
MRLLLKGEKNKKQAEVRPTHQQHVEPAAFVQKQ